MTKVFESTGEKFVILMDGYDVLVRENVPDELFSQYLDFLNGLFKSDTLRPAVALAYLTGILPIVLDKVQSKLNNFDEYTILNAGKLSEFAGFTTIFALNRYTIVREMTTEKSVADVVLIPFVKDMPAMIIELKRNGKIAVFEFLELSIPLVHSKKSLCHRRFLPHGSGEHCKADECDFASFVEFNWRFKRERIF